MSKYSSVFLLCIIFVCSNYYAQGVIFSSQIKTIPENPVAGDTVCLIATIGSAVNCRHTINKNINKNDNSFTVNVCYYALCDAGEVFNDTFCLGILTQVKYTIDFSVSYSSVYDSCSVYDSAIEKLEFDVMEKSTTLFIPNVISPNGDGVNDFFELDFRGIGNINTHIYNRWGNCVFKSNDNSIHWPSEKTSSGTYFYVISGILNGNTVEHKGFITVFH